MVKKLFNLTQKKFELNELKESQLVNKNSFESPITSDVLSKLFKYSLLIIALIVHTSCGDDAESAGIDRSALIGTWAGNDYECIFEKPGSVTLIISKGPDPLGLKINLNNGQYLIDADYGEGDNTKSFIGEYESSSYSILISGILYDDGVMKLSVFPDDELCDATLTKK